jgi:hypothetical protein
MSLYDISWRLTRLVPDTPLISAQDSVVEALAAIYDATDWSFQKSYAGWLAPGVIFQNGSFTTTPYLNTIVADATASAALIAYTGQPLLTQLQYRNPAYSIYNIIGFSNNAGVVTLTLDRPWMEPTSGPGQPFMIYQCYFVAPVQYFRKFVEIRDTTNDDYIDFWGATQADLAVWDPQRLNFSNPEYCVPCGMDQRPGSATLGWQMFELWPQQGNYVPYSFSYRAQGPLPQQQSDFYSMTTPQPITERMTEWKARQVLLNNKAAAMESKVPGSGKGMMLLASMAEKEYYSRFGEALAIDLNLDGESRTQVHNVGRFLGGAPYATMNGGVNLGGYNGGGSES